MSESSLSQDRINADRLYDRAMFRERGVWTSWMEILLRSGPDHTEAASAVHSSSIRYNAIASLRRSFGDPYFYVEPRSYEAPKAKKP